MLRVRGDQDQPCAHEITQSSGGEDRETGDQRRETEDQGGAKLMLEKVDKGAEVT